jgi:hypothetical protein
MRSQNTTTTTGLAFPWLLPQNPQPTPPGYKPFPTFTADEQRALALAYNRALSALDSNTDCQNLFVTVLSQIGIIGRNASGNQIDVYNYTSRTDALTSTRTVMVTAIIPVYKAGVKCPQ